MPLVVGSVCACEVCVVFMIEQLAVCTEQTNTRLRLWGRERVFLFVFFPLLFACLKIEDWEHAFFLFFMLFEDWELGRRPALNPWDCLTVLRVALYTWQLHIIQIRIAFQKFNWYNLQILQSHSLILEKCKVFCCWKLFKLVYSLAGVGAGSKKISSCTNLRPI